MYLYAFINVNKLNHYFRVIYNLATLSLSDTSSVNFMHFTTTATISAPSTETPLYWIITTKWRI